MVTGRNSGLFALGPMANIVLSHFQIELLLGARKRGELRAITSSDLNLTKCSVMLADAGVSFPSGEQLSWTNVSKIAHNPTKCFKFQNGELHEIAGYSEITAWPRSLYPTTGAPTMLVSGITMHRIQGTDPLTDTRDKIRAVSPVRGQILDTATGLGYTAIEAAKSADEVTTVELDPLSLEIARDNPWSQGLFTNSRIHQLIGDVFDLIEQMDSEQFSCIIHDPPMFSLAGDLYSRDFYVETYRVLRRRGRMFHYIGDLTSRSGLGVLKGVVRRLEEAGYSRIVRKQSAFGVVAYK